MDDSFSLFAKSIRQNKINKEELLNNLKKISESQTKKDKYIKNIIKIQKMVRGHLYRIKYHLSLDEINTKTIIDYLYEKKKKRIHSHSKEIISFFVLKYINKLQKTKKQDMLQLQYKIHCSNLIKARLRGILVRRHVKEKLILVKKAKLKIIKQILRYRTILILKSNTMQNLLLEIGKIKYQLKNLEKNSPKVKELKNKLSKNINLFHDTYYYSKENCNWIIEKKTEEKWDKKYFDIINKKTEKIINKNKKEIKSSNNGYTNYLHEFYNDSDNNNEDIGDKKSNYSSTLTSSKNKTKVKERFLNKKYESSSNVSEFKIEDMKNNKEIKKDKDELDMTTEEDINPYLKNNNYKGKRKFVSDKKLNFSKEINKIFKNDINNIDLNNINSHKLLKKEKEKEEINVYQQREERPIKPLKTNDILNCENPFGLRDNNIKKTNTYKPQNNFRNSFQYSNQFNNQSNQYQKRNTIKSKMPYRDLDENNLQNNETEEYGYYNSSKTNRNYFLNRDEKPIGGNKIDYEALFGSKGEINFKGDPFGGAKQFETDKSKIMLNKSNATTVRKKPKYYDARKAIEEAKIKEAKEGKKEKHTEFREFLKEMKKISTEEKLKNNEKNQNKKDNSILDMKKSYSESINQNGKEIFNGKDIYKNNYVKEEIKDIDLDKKRENVKRERSVNKTSSNKMMRKKLHDLEKGPAPMINIKEAKSKIECWFDKNSNNSGNKYMEYANKNASSNRSNGQKKTKKGVSDEYDEIKNNIRNKKMQNKIENYVDKKLSQLNLQIDKLNDVFSIESYFEQKERKMKKFMNVPYIKEGNMYVKNYTEEIYNDLISEIYKDYKALK